jgi:hypothetical protein
MEESISMYPFCKIVDDVNRRKGKGVDKWSVFDLLINSDRDPLFPRFQSCLGFDPRDQFYQIAKLKFCLW